MPGEVVAHQCALPSATKVAIHTPHLTGISFVEVVGVIRRVAIVECPGQQIGATAPIDRPIDIVIADVETTTTVVDLDGREVLIENVVLDLRATVGAVEVVAVEVNAAIVGSGTAVVDE